MGTIHLMDFDIAVPIDDHDVTDLSRRAVINYTVPEWVEPTSLVSEMTLPMLAGSHPVRKQPER